jgi:hypothetical protein
MESPKLTHQKFERFSPTGAFLQHFLRLSAPLTSEPGSFANYGTGALVSVIYLKIKGKFPFGGKKGQIIFQKGYKTHN